MQGLHGGSGHGVPHLASGNDAGSIVPGAGRSNRHAVATDSRRRELTGAPAAETIGHGLDPMMNMVTGRLARIACRAAAAGGLTLAMLVPAAHAETASAPVVTARTRATLVAADAPVVPGTTVAVALDLDLKPGWHTYWRNPGDSGEPATVTFHVEGREIKGPQVWPAPERIDTAGIVSYGHAGDVTLVTMIPVPADAKGDAALRIDADATWLVCEKVCVPEKGRFTLSLPVASGAKPSAPDATRSPLLPPPLPQAAGLFEKTAQGWTLRVAVPASDRAAGPVVDAYFFPERGDLIDHSAAQALQGKDGEIILSLASGQIPGPPPPALRGVLAVTQQRAGGAPQTRYLDVAARPAAEAR
jgi:thiol:disulfide interchange protein DsbD